MALPERIIYCEMAKIPAWCDQNRSPACHPVLMLLRLQHFYDLARVHYVTQKVVDVSKACGLSFGGCRVGAVPERHRNDIARLGVPRQPLHTPVRRTTGNH